MQKGTADQAQYLLQSVDNALRLLNLFAGEGRLSLTEIAARMGCGKTIAYRLTYTLERRGFLCRGSDGKYSLGMRLFTLGQKVLSEKSYLPPRRWNPDIFPNTTVPIPRWKFPHRRRTLCGTAERVPRAALPLSAESPEHFGSPSSSAVTCTLENREPNYRYNAEYRCF